MLRAWVVAALLTDAEMVLTALAVGAVAAGLEVPVARRSLKFSEIPATGGPPTPRRSLRPRLGRQRRRPAGA
jgi:hypothetical protein